MARKGKLGKKPNAENGFKQDISKAKGPPKDKAHEGEAAKKGSSQGDAGRKGTSHSDAAKKVAGKAIANLGGFIFMCNSSTKADCFKYRVFGLNDGKKNLVEQVRKGMRLFLFDIDLRLLYGIYTAASPGSFKLERDAFGGAFPWQVRFSIQKDCIPLSEDFFRAAIKENYVDNRKFKVELTTEQVHRLVKLFRPLPGGPGRSPPRLRVTPPRPRMTASDRFDDVPEPRRFPEVDTYAHDRHSLVHLPPRTKYGPHNASSDRFIAEKQTPYAQSLTKYAHLYPSDDQRVLDGHTRGISPRANRESIYGADDLYLGRELRHNQIGVGSVIPGHSLAPASLSAYSADSLRPLSDLRQPRARDDGFSVYSQGNTLGAGVDSVYRSRLQVPDVRGDISLGAGVDSVYRSRLQVPDVRGDILDRRASALDPLAESLAYTGGLSSEVLRGRPLNDPYTTGYGAPHRYESSTGLLSGITGASGLSYHSERLPQSRYYGGGGF